MARYISKSAIVAEIERRLWLLVQKMTFHQQREELEKLLSFINNLEVKEGDLDALGVLANHLIACNAHGITPKYSNRELDLLERLANIKAQKEEPASENLAKNPELSGWVARDKDGDLHVFEVKPKRCIDDCRWWDRDYKCSAIDKNAFQDLKWEDEPVCVKLIIIKED